ncbi:enolase C-terminal domain-like protein [Embleya sp. MST-111070]|uniref:enolase C-terminal domain-like protein n=1 Tax=Embleya sp. MST-111070 TaxID=3398231 RepID=UPI003F7368C5
MSQCLEGGAAGLTVESVDVVGLGPGPFAPGDGRFAVVARAGGLRGCYGPVDEMVAALVAARVGGLAVGRRVDDHAGTRAVMLRALGPHARGLGECAVGAVDCALWDLHGQAAGVPVARLLCREPASEVPAYASWLSLDTAAVDACDRVRELGGRGFAFTKWGLRRGREARGAELAERAARLACWAGGAVAVDALGTWDIAFTDAFARASGPRSVLWVEDPLAETDTREYAELSRRASLSGVGLAFGERVTSPDHARRLLAVCPPAAFTFDVLWCGGITAAMELVEAARRFAVPVYPHGRALVPGLHVAAACADVVRAVEYQVAWEPHRQASFTHTFVPDHGSIRIPDRPGLGLIPHEER